MTVRAMTPRGPGLLLARDAVLTGPRYRMLKGGLSMTAEQNKLLVQRLVEEAVNPGNLEVLDDVAEGEFAAVARRWIGPFRDSFPDFKMEIVDLVADSQKVAAHFRCSGTQRGEWMGHPATGRSFRDVDEIYIFRVRGGKLAGAFGVEDNVARMRQLGLNT
jgi:predicted ester cyclase